MKEVKTWKGAVNCVAVKKYLGLILMTLFYPDLNLPLLKELQVTPVCVVPFKYYMGCL